MTTISNKLVVFISIFVLLILGLCLQFRLATTLSSYFRWTSTPFAIAAFIKDEADILDHWLAYHAKIVGAEHIVVLDNFSEEATLEILRRWRVKGVRVELNVSDYHTKGDKQFQALKRHFPLLEVAIPLDADEFLVSYQQGMPLFDTQRVRKELDVFRRSSDNDFACMSLDQYYSDCEVPVNTSFENERTLDPHVYPAYWAKKLFKMRFLRGLDHGGHFGRVRHPRRHQCRSGVDRLGLAHFHHRTPLVKLARAVRELIALGRLPPPPPQNSNNSHSNSSNSSKSNSNSNSHAALTSLDFLRPHEQALQDLISQNTTFGAHKIEEVLSFIRSGPEGLVRKCSDKVLHLNQTMLEILAAA